MNEQLKEVFKALEPDKPAVEAGELTLDGDTATVPLNYTWKIASAEWKYTVSAELKKSGGQLAGSVESRRLWLPTLPKARSSPKAPSRRSGPTSSAQATPSWSLTGP